MTLTSFSSTFALSAEPFQISQKEALFTSKTAEQILHRFPPQDYFYVGVGRSPALLMGYLDHVVPHGTATLPATEAKWLHPIETLTKDERAILTQHFLRYLPTEDFLKGRKILLIDFVHSGLSLLKVRDAINSLLTSPQTAESLGLVYRDYNDKDLVKMMDHQMLFYDKDQAELFLNERYDRLAPYTEANMARLSTLSEVEPNPDHIILIDAVKKTFAKQISQKNDCPGLLTTLWNKFKSL